MTSTVLDVTVLLLCVSASVITLGVAGGGPDAGDTGYTADDVADRLATETATVEYEPSEAERDSLTVHATLVELLSMAAVAETWDDTRTADRYRTRVIATVEDALGPRTRVDVRYRIDDVDTPSGDSNVRSVSTRSGTRVGLVRSGTDTDPDASTRRSTRDHRSIGVGPEPPGNTAVTTAVVSHPTSERVREDSERTARLRVVIRVW